MSTLLPSKIQFRSEKITSLGCVLLRDEIPVSTVLVKAIVDLSTPQSPKEMCSFSSIVRFCKSIYARLHARVTAPALALTGKEYALKCRFHKAWGSDQYNTVARVKRLLNSTPVSHYLDSPREFMGYADSSEAGTSTFSAQPSQDTIINEDLDIVVYFSRRFSQSQRHCSATMKKCCEVLSVLLHRR